MPVTSSLARFGLFELDLRTGELSKSGRRLRLQEQPFRLLRLLLEQPGHPITRERLRNALWPANTFVDFDHGLNTAVAKLRHALGDSADNPRFIETMSRYGYRFIAPVEFVNCANGAIPPPGLTTESPSGRARLPAPGDEQFERVETTDRRRENLVEVQQREAELDEGLKEQPVETRGSRFVSWSLAAIVIGVLLAAIAVVRSGAPRAGAPSNEPIHSLAVLPFETLSANTDQEYFADGMSAELITELAKIPSLRVISRTSAIRYKRTTKSVQQIARELNVEALVEGEVLQSGHRVRVTAKLIQTATDTNLWAETFERDLHDVLELQGELAQSIVDTIRVNVTRAQRARFTHYHRVDPQAYDSYLKGRFFWNKRTEPGMKKSVEYFQLAIQKDPNYALAHSGLADSYNVMGGLGFLPSKEAYLRAKTAANNALKLDNTLSEAHIVLADVLYELEWNWPAANKEFERAIKLNPSYATAHQRYSLFLMKLGRTEESLSEIYRARALDPLSLSINSSLGWRLVWARRYEDAIDELKKTLEMEPNYGWTHVYLAWAYEAKGNPEKAIYELRQVSPLDTGSEGLASLGHAYAVAGHTRQALDLLKQLEERSKGAHVAAYHKAMVYAGLGDRDRAFELLSTSCSNRDIELVSLNVDLELNSLHSDPRFGNLLRCVGLLR